MLYAFCTFGYCTARIKRDRERENTHNNKKKIRNFSNLLVGTLADADGSLKTPGTLQISRTGGDGHHLT